MSNLCMLYWLKAQACRIFLQIITHGKICTQLIPPSIHLERGLNWAPCWKLQPQNVAFSIILVFLLSSSLLFVRMKTFFFIIRLNLNVSEQFYLRTSCITFYGFFFFLVTLPNSVIMLIFTDICKVLLVNPAF